MFGEYSGPRIPSPWCHKIHCPVWQQFLLNARYIGLAYCPCAKEIGISFTTLCGIENGRDPDTVNLLLLLTWLGLPLSFLTGVGDLDPAAIYRRGWDDCAATVRAALDASDRAADADV